MRRLDQPGPVAAGRIESRVDRARLIELALECGLSLNTALTGPPGDAAHVAWCSAPRAPEGRAGWNGPTPRSAGATGPLSCIATPPGSKPTARGSAGICCPRRRFSPPACRPRARVTADVTVAITPDPETNFTLFHLAAARTAGGGARLAVARIYPNEDPTTAIEALCRRHGLACAAVRGSLGSLVWARFTKGRSVADHATEVLLRHAPRFPTWKARRTQASTSCSWKRCDPAVQPACRKGRPIVAATALA